MATPPFPWEEPGQQYDPNLPDWMQQAPDAVAYATPASPVVPVAPWEPELDPTLVNAPNANAVDEAIAAADQAPEQDPDLALLDMVQGPAATPVQPVAPQPVPNQAQQATNQVAQAGPQTQQEPPYLGQTFTKSGLPVGPDSGEYGRAYSSIGEQQKQAIEDEIAAKQEANNARALLEKQAQQDEAAAMAAERRRVAEDERTLQEAEQRIIEAQDAIPEPKGFFEGDPGKQVAALIGGFLGGMLAPYNNGRNMFLEQLNQAIDQDMRLQQMRAEQAQRKVSEFKDSYGRIEGRLQKGARERELERVRYRELAKERILTETRKYNNPILEARGRKMAADIDKANLDTFSGLVTKEADAIRANRQIEEQIRQRQQAAKLARDQFEYQKQKDAMMLRAAEEEARSKQEQEKRNQAFKKAYGHDEAETRRREIVIEGKPVGVMTQGLESAVPATQDKITTLEVISNILADGEAAIKEYGGWAKVPGAKKRELQVLMGMAQEKLTTYVTGAAAVAEQMKTFGGVTADNTSLFRFGDEGARRGGRKWLEKELRIALSPLAPPPGPDGSPPPPDARVKFPTDAYFKELEDRYKKRTREESKLSTAIKGATEYKPAGEKLHDKPIMYDDYVIATPSELNESRDRRYTEVHRNIKDLKEIVQTGGPGTEKAREVLETLAMDKSDPERAGLATIALRSIEKEQRKLETVDKLTDVGASIYRAIKGKKE